MKAFEFLRLIRRRWAWTVVGALVGLALGATGLLLPVKYNATAQVFIGNGLPVSKGSYEPILAASQYSLARAESWATLGNSTRVLQGAIDQLGLKASPNDITGRVQVKAIAKSVVIQVSADGDDVASASNLADAVAESLSRRIEQIETPPGSTTSIVDVWVSRPSAATTTSTSSLHTFLPVLGLLLGLGLGTVAAAVTDAAASERAGDPTSGPPEPPVRHGAPPTQALPFDEDVSRDWARLIGS